MIFILDTSAEKMDVKVGLKFGCLQILDDGTEYLEMMGMRISDIKEEKMEFLQAVKEGKYVRRDWTGWDGGKTIVTPAYIYKPLNFKVFGDSVAFSDFDKAIEELQKNTGVKRYKCRCRKCGKIRYYSEETLQTKPKVCYKPVYCSSRFTYSTKASNSNYNKRKNECREREVCL